MRQKFLVVGLTGLAALVTACAAPRTQMAQSACERVSGTATSAGRALAEQRAVADLRRQLPDVRGELVEGGYGSLKPTRARTTCAPYRVLGWSTGLLTCTASTTICGRPRR